MHSDSNSSALLVDRYQLTMMESYFKTKMNETAIFELFIRRLPLKRNFLVAAGLEQALEFLETLHFSPQELGWLESTEDYSQEFLEYLKQFKFRGDVNAVEEGTIFFPNEPILQIIAPLPVAQFVETRLINILNFQTLIASKAARTVLTAPDKTYIDFGLRRAHGYEAGLFAARASYLGGFAGTATVLAEHDYGISSFGTMAHSFIEAHQSELEAFENFTLLNPENAILLIDTYDTLEGAKKVCQLAKKLVPQGVHIKGVRIDSGNLAESSKKVRAILDEAGLQAVSIFVSGNLDEYRIQALLAEGAPIDSFGVGTHLTTSADSPYLDCVYKLQEYAGIPKRKKSENKATWPGKKQVFRSYDKNSGFFMDTIGLSSESYPGSSSLLQPVMKNGKRLHSIRPLTEIRSTVLTAIQALPVEYRQIHEAREPLLSPVKISDPLRALAEKVDQNQS